jgi:hypothetical protein
LSIAEIIFVDNSFAYNFKSVLQSPIMALKAKKIFVASFFLLLALVLFYLFTWLAFLINDTFAPKPQFILGIIPVINIGFHGFLPAFIFYFGLVLTFLAPTLGILGCAAIDFEKMRGNHFFSAGQAIRFSFSRLKQMLLSWIGIALFIGFIVLLAFIVGLITRIPYLGEILYSLFFFFPSFVIAMFTVLALFVLILSYLVMPVAVAADQKAETFNSILESFSTLIRQPVRWTLYTLYSFIAAKIAGFIYAYFAFRAIQFLILTTSWGGGEKINNIITSGLSHLPLQSGLVSATFSLFPGFNIHINRLAAGTADNSIAGYIMAISLFLIFLSIWGYIISVIASGQAAAFAVIKKIRDNHAISDEKSLYYEEEWVNPPIDENSEDNNKSD